MEKEVIFILIDFRSQKERRHHSSISSPNNNKTQPIKEYLDNTRILIVEDNKINMLLAKKIGKENNAKLYHFEATLKSYQVV
jgi:putative cell wall-binding protein